MKLIKMESHWFPMAYHGSLSYNNETDVGALVVDAVRRATRSMPAHLRTTINDATEIKYIIEPRADGTQVLVFELIT